MRAADDGMLCCHSCGILSSRRLPSCSSLCACGMLVDASTSLTSPLSSAPPSTPPSTPTPPAASMLPLPRAAPLSLPLDCTGSSLLLHVMHAAAAPCLAPSPDAWKPRRPHSSTAETHRQRRGTPRERRYGGGGKGEGETGRSKLQGVPIRSKLQGDRQKQVTRRAYQRESKLQGKGDRQKQVTRRAYQIASLPHSHATYKHRRRHAERPGGWACTLAPLLKQVLE